ncbi:GlsB/YeaQ/YmgE family stress response membrane protein [Rubrobacter aplysinae]|uniref:GlsB/YeaQ/YmgE family stress response membrane protein n=1 Tax=Rubrobacter aplysinae TaxID=909625 RepID=UPI00064B9AF0|nr:GlsB/YeaQ/YmgE family stress response membrane protein [Rubrobacter aplysinae]
MGILTWIIFGLIAGALAKLIMPGDDPGGCIVTMLIGIVGAFLGGFLYSTFLGGSSYMQFSVGSLIVAIIGALIILGIYRLIIGRS